MSAVFTQIPGSSSTAEQVFVTMVQRLARTMPKAPASVVFSSQQVALLIDKASLQIDGTLHDALVALARLGDTKKTAQNGFDVDTLTRGYLKLRQLEEISVVNPPDNSDKNSVARGDKREVVVAEDDPAIAKLLKRYLENLGFAVHTVCDGQDALVAVAQRHPSLVCIDLMLPRMSGFDLCEAIKGNPTLKDIPVLVLSARTSPVDIAHAEEAGANGFLAKPVRFAEFSQKVQSLVIPAVEALERKA